MSLLPRRRKTRRDGGEIDFGWATSVGRRADNQDRAAVSGAWAVLSDGVGGQPGGARAAELVVDAAGGCLERCPPPLGEAALLRAVRRAGDAVREGRRSSPALSRMDATLTIALATSVEDGLSRWLVGWVGDSPAWVVTGSEVRPLTTAHTLATVLAGGGAVRRGDAVFVSGRNVLMRTVATEDVAGPDVAAAVTGAGEGLIVASDGLAEGIGPDDMGRVWASSCSAQEVADRLVALAVEAGASDNVTAAVLRHSGR